MTELLKAQCIHFIGIGGVSMSAIAHIFLERGYQVTGSDVHVSERTQALEKAGATIYYGQSASHIHTQDAVVFTAAVHADNPEYQQAQHLNIPLFRRTQALNAIMSDYKTSIAITGTHGKTSTTTMVAMILEEGAENASYLVGAKLPQTNKAYKIGQGSHIAVEACEYQASFLDLYPTTVVITNIEEEHMDYYDDLKHVMQTYQDFTDHLTSKNYLIANIDDFNTRRLLKQSQAHLVTYGINQPATFMAKHVTFDQHGYPTFDVYYEDDLLTSLTLSVRGKYNVYNALSAIAATYVNGIGIDSIVSALSKFVNAERRFEYLGDFNGSSVISDYAHHPSEVKAALSAARNFENKEICVVFQPHTYSRLKSFLIEFSSAFKDAHHIFITDIYAAREDNIYNIHSQDLIKHIQEEGQEATFVEQLEDVPRHLNALAGTNTLIIMMGAGDIDTFARQMVAPHA